MIKCKEDYVGRKFNHLTVIEQAEDYVGKNGRIRPQFLCECDCKEENPNRVIVRLDGLKNGHTASCGCLQLKHTLDLCNDKRKPMKDSEFLELNLVDDEHKPYGRCKASNSDNYYYFSMQDYETIKDYCWYENIKKSSDYHRLVTSINGKPIVMHKFFGMLNPDHINRNALDNRRENLDNFATKTIQSQNRKLQRNNTSGCRGISFSQKYGKWAARIKKNGKEIYIGTFVSKDEAIIARLNAEKIYFDKRSWQIQLMKKYGIESDVI